MIKRREINNKGSCVRLLTAIFKLRGWEDDNELQGNARYWWGSQKERDH
jgi:hypothetical protein